MTSSPFSPPRPFSGCDMLPPREALPPGSPWKRPSPSSRGHCRDLPLSPHCRQKDGPYSGVPQRRAITIPTSWKWGPRAALNQEARRQASRVWGRQTLWHRGRQAGTVRPAPGTGLEWDPSFSADPTGPSGKPRASVCPWDRGQEKGHLGERQREGQEEEGARGQQGTPRVPGGQRP